MTMYSTAYLFTLLFSLGLFIFLLQKCHTHFCCTHYERGFNAIRSGSNSRLHERCKLAEAVHSLGLNLCNIQRGTNFTSAGFPRIQLCFIIYYYNALFEKVLILLPAQHLHTASQRLLHLMEADFEWSPI